jgi:hypothetical protein
MNNPTPPYVQNQGETLMGARYLMTQWRIRFHGQSDRLWFVSLTGQSDRGRRTIPMVLLFGV